MVFITWDTASAVLNGLLSYRYRNRWYVFDVKTWRVSILKVCDDQHTEGIFQLCIPVESHYLIQRTNTSLIRR
ncbi:hypothetical protein THRCLA_21121 [Thraustotheca clavata]|uniref:Uncharacterized protein n=1 Tax=Thraustotheca clavata TaxID=74557 RepID=A0A1W0A019_9STRA|nr:hypothetical protein THRCLA_21121 [Thraustotheca clavata]